MLKTLLLKNRSYRRFYPEPALSEAELKDLIEAARFSPSARNDQPLKYLILHSRKACNAIFPFLAWAGYLSQWPGPSESERPTSYIIMLLDKQISDQADTDAGIACQSIMLSAVEKGFGGCILGAIQREGIRRIFNIDQAYEIRYVIALGKPSESVVTETHRNGNTRYYRSEDGTHHVPKRSREELILNIL
ncbi:MAG: nitroreductase family protein [bacterium]|jgi:nitroreductase|nr:nitroreductase family protein [bacterium]